MKKNGLVSNNGEPTKPRTSLLDLVVGVCTILATVVGLVAMVVSQRALTEAKTAQRTAFELKFCSRSSAWRTRCPYARRQ